MIFCVCEILRKFDINSLYNCPPLLYTVATLPWEIQKSHFSAILFIHTSDYLRYLTRNELQLLYCNLFTYCCLCVSYYLCSHILWPIFESLWSVIFRATNANPQPAPQSHQHLEECNIICSQM